MQQIWTCTSFEKPMPSLLSSYDQISFHNPNQTSLVCCYRSQVLRKRCFIRVQIFPIVGEPHNSPGRAQPAQLAPLSMEIHLFLYYFILVLYLMSYTGIHAQINKQANAVEDMKFKERLIIIFNNMTPFHTCYLMKVSQLSEPKKQYFVANQTNETIFFNPRHCALV